jgi:hypothetical protein
VVHEVIEDVMQQQVDARSRTISDRLATADDSSTDFMGSSWIVTR